MGGYQGLTSYTKNISKEKKLIYKPCTKNNYIGHEMYKFSCFTCDDVPQIPRPGGGTPQNFGWGVPHGSQNPDPISDQNV